MKVTVETTAGVVRKLKFRDGDVWLPNDGSVPVTYFEGLVRYPQGIGQAVTGGREGLTPEQFLERFPDAIRLVDHRYVERRF